MAFAPTTIAGGAPNPVSALELITLVVGCYWNNSSAIASVLAQLGGGTILGFRFSPITWPPSWTVVRSGSTIVICFAGTDNVPHIFGDTTGAFGTPYRGGPVQAHKFFLSSWQDLQPTILALMPADVATCSIIFTGHSMGAAELFFAACDFVQAGIGASVELLTFSPAKCLTKGFAGPLPSPANYLCAENDAVPFLPPFNGISSVLGAQGNAIFGIPIGWTHYEAGWTYNNSSGFTGHGVGYWNAMPSAPTIGGTFSTHPTTFQSTVVIAIANNFGIDAAHETISKILLGVLETPAPPTVLFPPNPAAFIDYLFQNTDVFMQTVPPALTTMNARSLVTMGADVGRAGLTAADAIFSGLPAGVLNMAYIGAGKATFFFTDNLGGFSESWYLGNGPSGFTADALTLYLNLRLLVSGENTTFLYCRVSTVGSPRFVTVYYPADLNGLVSVNGQANENRGHAGVLAGSDIGTTCLLIRRYVAQYYSLWFMRGLPDSIVSFGGTYSPNNCLNFVNNLNSLFLWLGANGWGFVARGAQAQFVSQIASVATNPATGRATITLAGAPVFPQQSPLNPVLNNYQYRLAVRLRRFTTPTQANGVYTVTILSQSQAVTLDQFPYSGLVIDNTQQVVFNYPQVIPQLLFKVEKPAERKTGRPFGLRAGRQRSRLVR